MSPDAFVLPSFSFVLSLKYIYCILVHCIFHLSFLVFIPVSSLGSYNFSIRDACHLCVSGHYNILILASFHLSPVLGMDEGLVSNKSFASACPK